MSVSDIKYNTATVSFTTNEVSSSFIEFGKDANYGRIYGRDDSTLSHSITLPYDLTSATIYYYRVRTKDLSGNESLGVGSSFVTAANPNDLTSPVISSISHSEAGQNTIVSLGLPMKFPTLTCLRQDLSFNRARK